MANKNWFNGLQTVDEIKKAYRDLVMTWHPDRAGINGIDTEIANETMKEINNSYHEALSGNHETEQPKSDGSGETWTYWYNWRKEQEIVEMVDKLVSAGLSETVEILIVGFWIWVRNVAKGKPGKADRKKLGKDGLRLRWHSKRNAWYWRQAKRRSRYNENVTLDDLAYAYGAEVINHNGTQQDEENERLAIA